MSHTYGICIDLYIVIGLPNDAISFFNQLQPLFNRRINAMNWRSRVVRYLPLSNIPFYNKIQLIYRDFLFNNSVEYTKALNYYIIAGPLKLRDKMTYDRDIFKAVTRVKFEDREYMAISEWDYFLSLRYGDYMQLPPVDQRHPYHGGHYFWKEKK